MNCVDHKPIDILQNHKHYEKTLTCCCVLDTGFGCKKRSGIGSPAPPGVPELSKQICMKPNQPIVTKSQFFKIYQSQATLRRVRQSTTLVSRAEPARHSYWSIGGPRINRPQIPPLNELLIRNSQNFTDLPPKIAVHWRSGGHFACI